MGEVPSRKGRYSEEFMDAFDPIWRGDIPAALARMEGLLDHGQGLTDDEREQLQQALAEYGEVIDSQWAPPPLDLAAFRTLSRRVWQAGVTGDFAGAEQWAWMALRYSHPGTESFAAALSDLINAAVPRESSELTRRAARLLLAHAELCELEGRQETSLTVVPLGAAARMIEEDPDPVWPALLEFGVERLPDHPMTKRHAVPALVAYLDRNQRHEEAQNLRDRYPEVSIDSSDSET